MKYLVIICILSAFSISALAERDDRCPLINDPLRTIHLPHESDCTLFYKCDWGFRILFDCPPGLHFNPSLEVCDWPKEAECELGGTPRDPRCPEDDETLVQFPHEYNCSLFYICENGFPTLNHCVPGLHFNPASEICEIPENAGCDDGGDGGNPDPPHDPRCPPNNDGEAWHFPHEYDCTLFYKCDWGFPVLQLCPPGLHFNPTLQVCDWPHSAGCTGGDGGGGSTTTPGGGDTTTTSGDGGGITTTTPGVTTTTPEVTTTTAAEITTPCVRDPRCPPTNGPFDINIPNDDDCSLFFTCDWGCAIARQCPPGLHFNRELMVCDWPHSAGCENGGGVTTTTPGGGGTTTTPGDGGGITTTTPGDGGGITTPSTDSRCPPDNEGDAWHIPHEYDCTLFYKCDWGVPVLQKCPPGLHFNPTLQVCDWPANAGCVGGDGGGDTTTTPGDGGGITTTTPGDGGGITTPSTDPRCPADNEGDAWHIPHEYDCTLFYKCDWGVPVLQQCPPGLHFNPTLQVCDWPSNAGCVGGDGGGGGETTTSIPGGDPRCPLNPDGPPLQIPHEYDCELFYICDRNGWPILMNCPSGLHFNPETGLCDWPENAGCHLIGGDCTPDLRCPAENGEFAEHLPHEYDCRLFYKCDWGCAFLMQCPPGLHFNRELEVCDWPNSAGCMRRKAKFI